MGDPRDVPGLEWVVERGSVAHVLEETAKEAILLVVGSRGKGASPGRGPARSASNAPTTPVRDHDHPQETRASGGVGALR